MVLALGRFVLRRSRLHTIRCAYDSRRADSVNWLAAIALQTQAAPDQKLSACIVSNPKRLIQESARCDCSGVGCRAIALNSDCTALCSRFSPCFDVNVNPIGHVHQSFLSFNAIQRGQLVGVVLCKFTRCTHRVLAHPHQGRDRGIVASFRDRTVLPALRASTSAFVGYTQHAPGTSRV